MFIDLTWSLLTLAVLALSLATIGGFFGQLGWIVDLASHFRAQYCLALLAGSLIFAIGGKISLAILAAIFSLVNLGLILPYYRRSPTKTRQPATRTLRLLGSNLLQKNRSYPQVSQLISAERPDLIVLVEVNQTWLDELKVPLASYPFSQTAIREDNYGVALFSRLPLSGCEVRNFGPSGFPSVVVRIDLGGETLALIGTHPPPPKSAIETYQRDAQLQEIGAFVLAQPGPVMVVGDLNATIWSVGLRRMLKASHLRDSRLGFGLQATWPVDNRFTRVPIDHALVSTQIHVNQRRNGPAVGSDHLPIILDFYLNTFKSKEGK